MCKIKFAIEFFARFLSAPLADSFVFPLVCKNNITREEEINFQRMCVCACENIFIYSLVYAPLSESLMPHFLPATAILPTSGKFSNFIYAQKNTRAPLVVFLSCSSCPSNFLLFLFVYNFFLILFLFVSHIE